jgi:hypothetical protein
MNKPSLFKLDKTKLEITSLGASTKEETSFWLTKTPEERWAALELLRQQFYGDSYLTGRLQRTIEVIQQIPR